MSFRDYAKRVRAIAAELGVRASMTQLNDAIALACYGKKYSAVMASEGVGKLPPPPNVPPFITKAARQLRIDAHTFGLALQAGREGYAAPRPGNVVAEAVDWLASQHPQELDELGGQEFLSLASRELLDAVASSSHGVSMEMAHLEWILAEGVLDLHGERRRAIDLLREGFLPHVPEHEAAYIEALSAAPLRLYLIESVEPGFTMRVRELGRANPTVATVTEKAGSRPELQGLAIAARLLVRDGGYELAGGALLFSVPMMHRLNQQLRTIPADKDVSHAIRAAWLAQFDPAQQQRPQFVSSDGGDPMVFITDTYRCEHVEDLTRRLGADPRFHGNPEDGWAFLAEGADGLVRSVCGIHVQDPSNGIVTAFYETLARADRYRPEFERVAGGSIAHLSRQSEDPLNAALALSPEETRPSQPRLPADLVTNLIQQGIRKFYANWADEPIPALDGLTPRTMLSRTGGETRVRELLATYESNERGMAAREARDPISFDFLYEALGLSAHAGTSQPPTPHKTLRPQDFQVNEAWVVFRMFEEPLPTKDVGDINVLAIMDAASTCILNHHAEKLSAGAITTVDARRLLTEFQAQKPNRPASKLLLASNIDAPALVTEAQRLGLEVVRVHDNELLAFTKHARATIGAHFERMLRS